MKKLLIPTFSLFLTSCATDSGVIERLQDTVSLNRIYQGYATWYSSGRKTASGERFNPNGMTVAHRTLPFGTVLKLTNPENGNSIKVVVNDRGPFVKGKDLDVSRGGAKALGFKEKGSAKLNIEVVKQP
jgi:rare lipoprotein A